MTQNRFASLLTRHELSSSTETAKLHMRARVRKLREAIFDGKMAVCGESPRRIREELIVKLDQLLDISDDVALASAVEAFSMGAIKFVADQCGSECDELVNSIAALRS